MACGPVSEAHALRAEQLASTAVGWQQHGSWVDNGLQPLCAVINVARPVNAINVPVNAVLTRQAGVMAGNTLTGAVLANLVGALG